MYYGICRENEESAHGGLFEWRDTSPAVWDDPLCAEPLEEVEERLVGADVIEQAGVAALEHVRDALDVTAEVPG